MSRVIKILLFFRGVYRQIPNLKVRKLRIFLFLNRNLFASKL